MKYDENLALCTLKSTYDVDETRHDLCRRRFKLKSDFFVGFLDRILNQTWALVKFKGTLRKCININLVKL